MASRTFTKSQALEMVKGFLSMREAGKKNYEIELKLGVSARTASKYSRVYLAEGEEGLFDMITRSADVRHKACAKARTGRAESKERSRLIRLKGKGILEAFSHRVYRMAKSEMMRRHKRDILCKKWV